jgi:hypothetical protein
VNIKYAGNSENQPEGLGYQELRDTMMRSPGDIERRGRLWPDSRKHSALDCGPQHMNLTDYRYR